MPKVLLVDDDVKFCQLLKEYLEAMGFEVSSANTGMDGLAAALGERFDAVILDLMLPGIDGYEVLRRLRIHSKTPVLMLTGRGEEADRIVGLEMGADDYVPKTFSTRELLARLRAVLRRAATDSTRESAGGPIIVGDLCLDPASRSATVKGQEVSLTRIEFDLLAMLARGCGRVQSREAMLDEVGGRSFDVFDRSIDVHVASLRRKLGDNPKSPRYIETVRGAGYVLRPRVSQDL